MIILDTHAWLWFVDDPARLSAPAREAIEASDVAGVSAISALEVATLVRRGRIRLDRELAAWVRAALAHERIEEIPLSAACAARAGALDASFPGDPADRVIYASALELGTRLVTADRAIRAFDVSRTVW